MNPKAQKVRIVAIAFLAASCGIAHGELTSLDLPKRDGIKLSNLGLRTGRVRVHSACRISEQFDSNIFLKDSALKSDFITTFYPSVGIEVPFGRHMVSADYELAFNVFAENNRQNHIDERLRGLVEINLADYKISVKDTYRRFTNVASSETSTRLKEATNVFRAGVSAEFERLGFDVGYSNNIEHFLCDDIFYSTLTYRKKSTMTQIVDATISYRVWPKTYLQLENDFGFIRYYNTSICPGAFYVKPLVGFKGAWFKKASVNFHAGFKCQTYDSSDIITDKAFVGFVAKGGLDYFITDDDDIILSLERDVYDSIYQNMSYYTLNFAGLRWAHRFSDKISASVYGSFQYNIYPSQSTENGTTATRYDNDLGFGASLRYDIRKWASVEAKYDFRQRICKFDTFDYIDNQITLNGTVGF